MKRTYCFSIPVTDDPETAAKARRLLREGYRITEKVHLPRETLMGREIRPEVWILTFAKELEYD